MITSLNFRQTAPEIRSSSSNTRDQLQKLKEWFKKFDSALVAFSAGVDSSVLAYAARFVLGQNALAVTSISPSIAHSEIFWANKVAKEIGIELVVVTQDDLASEDYVANKVNRCFFCRSNLALAIAPIVKERNIAVCVDGTQVDDMKSPRPGVRALREAGFRAPFLELGFAKEDIRAVARHVKLSNAEKTPEACLSSRIAYGQRIDDFTLRRIEQSEAYIRELVHPKIVRVRTIGTRAVIELDPKTISKARKLFKQIQETLVTFGYESVEINPNGYLSGHMLDLFIHDTF